MNQDNQLIKTSSILAKETILKEAKALEQMLAYIDDENYSKVIHCLYHCKGRVIVSGIGKSAIIAQKIVATFNSTGTPSLYMHAADAIHGDLGMITSDDVVILISKSGESPEIKALIPLIANFGNPIIAITGNMQSYLATAANHVLDTTVDQEADPNNLAPTTSTTAQLVMGDTLAVCLLKLKGFTSSDFAKYHPGGALGKRLYLTVGDLSQKNTKPMVKPEDTFMEVLLNISSHRLGATVVIEFGKVIGIITDGDIRRIVQQAINAQDITARQLMSPEPKTIEINELAINALNIMRSKNISQLVVVENGAYAGMLHLHDLIAEGII